MERMLTAFWDEDRQEIHVRRPTGQEFRFAARQALAGGHEVFGVQTDGNDVWVGTSKGLGHGIGEGYYPRLRSAQAAKDLAK